LSMPEISLTDFVDFIVKSGTPKLTKVKELKRRDPDYDPAFDFWKPLREGLIEYHRSGGANKKQLDKIISNLSDPKKVGRYTPAIAGYKKFVGNKAITWFDPCRNKWRQGGLDVRVNPELGLEFKGQRHIIKLYFKNERPNKAKFDLVLAMMEDALHGKLKTGDTLAILDVSTGHLFKSPGPQPGLSPLLIGEATNFVTTWNLI
jgi:hypothetical protein